MEKITSFTVDHDLIVPGFYISRIDGDITTYDLRTRTPNGGAYMDHSTMHTVEHLFATYIRNSEIGRQVVYFGPMGCQTGFYLLVRSAEHDLVYQVVLDVLKQIIEHKGAVFGASRKECGHYENLNLENAIKECKTYKKVLEARPAHFQYPGEK